jgi:hypothetical protein
MRKSYDKNLVEYNELAKLSNNEVVIQMVSEVKIPFVKDREFIDVKINFYCMEL